MRADDPPDNEQIGQDLADIQDQLRRLHDQLRKRKPVNAEVEGEHTLDMNPLTAPDED